MRNESVREATPQLEMFETAGNDNDDDDYIYTELPRQNDEGTHLSLICNAGDCKNLETWSMAVCSTQDQIINKKLSE